MRYVQITLLSTWIIHIGKARGTYRLLAVEKSINFNHNTLKIKTNKA
ncbi:hypothetical protein Plhal304r1_c058g0145281 [Plasmopara halstedii]